MHHTVTKGNRNTCAGLIRAASNQSKPLGIHLRFASSETVEARVDGGTDVAFAP